jgi:hypothetical protein
VQIEMEIETKQTHKKEGSIKERPGHSRSSNRGEGGVAGETSL